MKKDLPNQLTVSYDKEADVLYITKGKPRESVGEMTNDGIVVRKDSKTKEIIGFTIVDFTEHFSNDKPQWMT